MARGKGPGGITCAEAIRQAISSEKITGRNLFERVREIGQGAWSEDHIWQEIMSRTVNLVPAYHHWEWVKERFLFQLEDGSYEAYSSARHGDRWKGYP